MTAALRDERVLVVGVDGVSFPYDLVTDVTGVVSRRGGGKSYCVHALVEEVVDAGIAQVIVIDPKGDYWGLRSSADGKGEGLPFTILGGQRGDLPLAHEAGALIGELAVESASHLLLDLSDFPSDSAECRFFAEFMQALYRLKARDHRIVLVVVEEAAQLLPQTQQGGAQKGDGGWQSKSLSAGHKVAKMGRGRGIGMVIVDQRIADVSKKSLAQAGRLLFGGMTSPLDLAAVDAYAKHALSPEDRTALMSAVASVPEGTLMGWGGGMRGVRLRARPLRTFDSHRTPKPGEHLAEPTVRAAVDLGALGARMSALVEEQAASDPVRLRQRVAELERLLAARPQPTAAAPVAPPIEVQVPALDDQQVKRLLHAADAADDIVRALDDHAGDFRHAAGEVRAALAAWQRRPAQPEPERPVVRETPPRPAPERPGSVIEVGGHTLRPYELELLRGFLVRSPATIVQLSVITGKSRKSSAFKDALRHFRELGLIEPGGEPHRITEFGRSMLGEEPVPTGGERLTYWRARITVPSQRVILDAIVEAGPAGLTFEEVVERTGYSATSSGTKDALRYLRDLGLISEEKGGPYRLADDLLAGSA